MSNLEPMRHVYIGNDAIENGMSNGGREQQNASTDGSYMSTFSDSMHGCTETDGESNSSFDFFSLFRVSDVNLEQQRSEGCCHFALKFSKKN